MKNKVHNSKKIKYFKSILTLIENGNIKFAKTELQKFLNKYPDDESAISIYIKLLFKDGEFDKATELSKNYLKNREVAYYYALMLKYCNKTEEAKNLFIYSYNCGKTRAIIQYIIILIKENNYEEAYNCFLKIPEKYIEENKIEINILRRYIYKKIFPELNDIIKNDNLNYFSAQILNYDDEILENKIIRSQNVGKSRFNCEIGLENIISYVQEKIEKEEPIYYDLFDRYIFEYPNVGTINRKNTDYIMVVTNLNTKEIVNIYPCSGVFFNNMKKSDVITKKYVIE